MFLGLPGIAEDVSDWWDLFSFVSASVGRYAVPIAGGAMLAAVLGLQFAEWRSRRQLPGVLGDIEHSKNCPRDRARMETWKKVREDTGIEYTVGKCNDCGRMAYRHGDVPIGPPPPLPDPSPLTDPLTPVTLTRMIRRGTDISAEADLAGSDADSTLDRRSAAEIAADEEAFRRREDGWTEEVEALLANHPDLCHRFMNAHYMEATGHYAVHNRIEGRAKVLIEIRDGLAGSADIAALRSHIAEGVKLDTTEAIDGQTGMPPLVKDDPLYRWALAAWRWLYEHRFDDAARGFKGGADNMYFEAAFDAETREAGRASYRNRRVSALKDLLGVLESAEAGQPARVEGDLRSRVERARAKKETFIQAGERLRERLDGIESEELLWALIEDIDTWRGAVYHWAVRQRGRPGSYALLEAFGERPDPNHFQRHSQLENVVFYINHKLGALHLYDPEDDQ